MTIALRASLRIALRAGLLYALAVFALGFVLGTVRVLFLAPRFGETAAVLAELPIMLVASWFLCRVILRRRAVPPTLPARSAMGVAAFALLILAELLLALALGRSAAAVLTALATPAGGLGLVGQLLFALFPLLQRKQR